MPSRAPAILRRRWPALADVVDSTPPAAWIRISGGRTIRLIDDAGRAVTLFSPRDPQREAWDVIRSRLGERPASPVVLFGVGAGHRLVALLAEFDARRVVGVVVNASVFRAALDEGMFDAVLDDPRVEFVRGDACGLAALDEVFAAGNGSILTDDAELRFCDADALPTRRLADHLATYGRVGAESRAKIRANFRANVALLATDTPVRLLAGAWKNEPAIIVGAGPSLSVGVEELRAIRDRVRIIAVDAAVEVLEVAGIRADLAVSVDPYDANARQCDGFTAAPPLVYLPSVHPDVPAHWPAPRVAALPDLDPVAQALDDLWRIGRVASGGIVGTTATALADVLGASQLVLLGMDLAFSGGRTHADGAFHAASAPERTYLDPVPSIGGDTVWTNASFRRAISWFELFAAAKPLGTCLDAGRGGAVKRGWVATDLDAVAARSAPMAPWAVPNAPLRLDSNEAVRLFDVAAKAFDEA
ncbi:MAG: DUF115 domain-containing protein [Deltaproteobacteria bacterium]|nr:DUF115 domain-containing protein [Deltaproteobacteria bacterium]